MLIALHTLTEWFDIAINLSNILYLLYDDNFDYITWFSCLLLIIAKLLTLFKRRTLDERKQSMLL